MAGGALGDDEISLGTLGEQVHSRDWGERGLRCGRLFGGRHGLWPAAESPQQPDHEGTTIEMRCMALFKYPLGFQPGTSMGCARPVWSVARAHSSK